MTDGRTLQPPSSIRRLRLKFSAPKQFSVELGVGRDAAREAAYREKLARARAMASPFNSDTLS